MRLVDEIQQYLNTFSNECNPEVSTNGKLLLIQANLEIHRLNTLVDLIGKADTAKMQRLKQDNDKLREILNTAAGLLFRLEEYHCIQTDEDDFKDQLDHWRDIGRNTVKKARLLLNDRTTDAQKL